MKIFETYSFYFSHFLKWNKTKRQNVVNIFAGNTCQEPSLKNGMTVPQPFNEHKPINGRYQPGSEIYFVCNDGYTRGGAYSRECMADGTWERDIQSCSNKID